MDKCICLADPHLDSYYNCEIDSLTGISEKLLEIKKALYFCSEYCMNNKIKNIIICGDIFHSKSRISNIAMNILIEWIRYYQNENNSLYFHLLDGNHDLSSRGKEYVSALKCVEAEPNVFYYNKPIINENIAFVPYGNQMVEFIKNNSCDYLFSHFGLNEAKLNSGLSIIADIGIKNLRGKYKNVILGHYHLAQEIILEDINIYYVGSLIELDWGERDNQKRFLEIDFNTHNILSIPITTYKKHIELKIDNSNMSEIIDLANSLEKEGHKVKIIMEEEIKLNNLNNGIIINKKIEKDVTNRGITSSMTDNEKIKKYLEIRNIESEKFDEYFNYLFEIIQGDNNEKS